jgi:hypothetical protein
MNSLTYRTLAALAIAAGGCSAGVKATGAGTAGNGGGSPLGTAGTGGSGGGFTTGLGGVGSGGSTGAAGTGSNTDAGGCQSASVTGVPKIPTVYLVVDRSGSMFNCQTNGGSGVCADHTNTSWTKLKGAIESVIASPGLDSQVRFGFTTIYGTNPNSGGSCPVLGATAANLQNNIAPALNNAATITAAYDAIPFPDPNGSSTPGQKLESPASEALAAAADALEHDTTTMGDKFMIFITDGQEDYCDDSIDICSSDSTVWRLQAAYAAGIKTIVFGLQTANYNLAPGVLQAFANAGAGEATVAPLHASGQITDFYYQCNGTPPYNGSGGLWSKDLMTAGKTAAAGSTLGTYSSTAGPTMPYTPDATNQSQLVTQLTMALSGVKSCVFDLSDVNGTAIKVNLNKLDRGSVTIDGNTILLDPTNTNGWDMISQTQLQLFGTACTAWQAPTQTTIDFNFPCDIIIN